MAQSVNSFLAFLDSEIPPQKRPATPEGQCLPCKKRRRTGTPGVALIQTQDTCVHTTNDPNAFPASSTDTITTTDSGMPLACTSPVLHAPEQKGLLAGNQVSVHWKKIVDGDIAKFMSQFQSQLPENAAEAETVSKVIEAECHPNLEELQVDYCRTQNHAYPPSMLMWYKRDGKLSTPRWVYLRCCCAVGELDKEHGYVQSKGPCSGTVPESARQHIGPLILLRSSSYFARQARGPVAMWECCGAIAVPTWQSLWDRVGMLPPNIWRYYDNGCGTGTLKPIDFDPIIELKPVLPEILPTTLGSITNTQSRIFDGSDAATLLNMPASSLQASLLSPIASDVLELFRITPEIAYTGLWIRGVGGNGCAEIWALIGDKVYSLCVMEELVTQACAQRPLNLKEGEFTRRQAYYTSNFILDKIARKLRIPAELASWPQTRGRHFSQHEMATIMESLIGLTAASNGMAAAKQVSKRLMTLCEQFPRPLVAAMSRLIEYFQGKGVPVPKIITQEVFLNPRNLGFQGIILGREGQPPLAKGPICVSKAEAKEAVASLYMSKITPALPESK